MSIKANDQYRPFARIDEWSKDLAVGDAWEDLGALHEAQQSAEPPLVDRAIQIALRSAALETGAIEGLYVTNRGITRTVAVQGAMWEAELDKLGPDVKGHFQAQLAAFDLVLDAATKKLDISEAWIRSLHEQVCASQKTYRVQTPFGWQDQPFRHGEYKSSPNNVTLADGTIHWYASVQDVAPEMHRLTEELRSSKFQDLHPVLQAAYAHHSLTAIHPFADGNGRVARALASVFLYRAAGIPLVIFSDQQERYWDALADADGDRSHSFVTFTEDRALDTMALVADLIRRASQPLDQEAVKLKRILVSHGGLSHAEVQAVGLRLADKLRQAFTQAVEAISLPQDVYVSQQVLSGRQSSNFWDRPYHSLLQSGVFKFYFSIQDPVTVQVEITPFVGIANELTNRHTFIVIDANRTATPPLRLRIQDLHPAASAAADNLIEGWVEIALQPVLRELAAGTTSTLESQGY